MDIRDLSSDYIDGELAQEKIVKLKAHLEWCAPCLAFMNTLRATVGLFGSSDAPEPPASLPERIRESLKRESAR
jgi:predicted anti-sigma-YlaC factor YlaD